MYPFLGGEIEQASKQVGKQRSKKLGGEQKTGHKWGGGKQEVGGGGEKRNHPQSISIILLNSGHPLMGSNRAIFDCLVACQSKSYIRNLTFMHPQYDKIKIHMAEPEEAFKFSVQETWKDCKMASTLI